MSEKTSLRITKCTKDSHYIVMGRKAKINLCTEHRYRADFEMLIERGLLTVTMLSEQSETKCEAPVFKVTGTI